MLSGRLGRQAAAVLLWAVAAGGFVQKLAIHWMMSSGNVSFLGLIGESDSSISTMRQAAVLVEKNNTGNSSDVTASYILSHITALAGV
jgi:hypothetical protein